MNPDGSDVLCFSVLIGSPLHAAPAPGGTGSSAFAYLDAGAVFA